MINYYKLLNIPPKASKHKAFRAFRKQYFNEEKADVNIELLTGLLLVLNERQKFLDILLLQQERNEQLNPKYQMIIASERKKAETVINNSFSESQLRKALKVYPLKEAADGLLFLFLRGADRFYFEFSYMFVLIGVIFLIQSIQNSPLTYVGFALILLGIFVHIRIVHAVKIRKIERITVIFSQ